MAAEGSSQGKRFSLARALPLLAVLAALALVLAMGWHSYLSPRMVAENRSALKALVAGNFIAAVALYMAVYAGVIALSIPGGLVLTLLGGFLFGWLLGGVMVVIAATIGASAIFLIAKTALGDQLAGRAGPFLGRLREGFAADAFNYLLFLRLVPAFPFWLVNLAPAFLGVPFRTFVLGTLVGIIPGTFAYAAIGGGLDTIFARAEEGYRACLEENGAGSCQLEIDASALLNPTLLAAFVALGIVALLPVVLRRLKNASRKTIEPQ